ncbi:NAD(P)H-dependent oxidoreductase [Mycoplasmatota bacterium]|nr:NAD(P)H-dependent oxidoreductase [Mycoplasmatota bacterium]
MKRIIKFFKRFTNPKIFRISMLLFFLAIFIMDNHWFGQQHLSQVTEGVGMIDMNIINSVNGIHNQLGNMGNEGRLVYTTLLQLDFLIIITLGFFQIISLLKMVGKNGLSSQWEYLIFLPISRGLFDGIENVLLYIATIIYPSKNVLLLKVTGLFIFTKWIAFWLTIVVLLCLVVVSIYNLIKKRREEIMRTDIKIIGVTASARKEGLGRELVDYALNGAVLFGAEVEIIDLYEAKLEFCTGCMDCLELGKCGQNDKFEMIKDKLYKADGIVICAPTYCGTYSAVMKNFIDRLGLYEHLTSSLGEKYILSISTGGGQSMAKQTAIQMSKALAGGPFARGYISGVMGGSYRPGDEVIAKRVDIRQRSLNKAEKLGQQLVEDISNNKKYLFQNIFSRLLSKLVLRPVYIKFIMKNKKKNTKAVYNNLVSRNIL